MLKQRAFPLLFILFESFHGITGIVTMKLGVTGPVAHRLLKSNQFQKIKSQRMRCAAVGSSKKVVWVKTNNQEVFTTALECGISDTIYIDDDNAETWQHLGRINVIKAQPDNTLTDTTTGTTVGCIQRLANAADLIVAQEIATTTTSGIVVIDAADWQIIPAENLVAVFQSIPGTQLLCVARSVVDSAIPMLEALEIGADGVVLETADPQEVRLLAAYFAQRNSESQEILTYDVATVSVVKAVASGDRACVDLASVMVPGEGMLVGSFARGMFLVHSECEESGYINSRPFRVNAGPVSCYFVWLMCGHMEQLGGMEELSVRLKTFLSSRFKAIFVCLFLICCF